MKKFLPGFLLFFFALHYSSSFSQCCSNGVNMLENYNPDFSGAIETVPPGFETDNIYSVTLGPGFYSVIISRNYGACSSTPEYDHTYGDDDGDYLWFDTPDFASTINPAVAWMPYDPTRPPGQENTLDVIPNTDYVFSVWIRDLARNNDCVTGGAPIMGLRINGEDMAQIDLDDYTSPCCPEWIYLCSMWNSGQDTEVLIQIESRIADGFTDLGIDDVYFGTTFANFEGILGDDINVCADEDVILDPGLTDGVIEWSDGSTADTLLVTEPGLYWVDMQQSGCDGRDSILVSIITEEFDIYLGPDTTICENQPLYIYPQIDIQGTFTWQDGTHNNYFIAEEPGWYWLNLETSCGDASDSLHIDVSPLPAVTLGNDTTICENASITLYENSVNEDNLLWSTGSNAHSITTEEAGLYWVQANNECGSDRDSINVGNFVSELQNSWEIISVPDLCGKSLFVEAKFTGSGASSIEWDNSEGYTSNEDSIAFSYYGNGIYELELKTTDACGLEQTLLETFNFIGAIYDHELVMPNIFTPNPDGKNSRFIPIIPFDDPSEYDFSMTIYNRWGQELNLSENAMTGWDGQFNSTPCSEGIYYYVVQYSHPCNEGERVLQGSLTLIR